MAESISWLLLGILASAADGVSAQTASKTCDHQCQVSCQANFTECYQGYPQNPVAPGGCEAVRGVAQCFKDRLKRQCQSAPGMNVSIHSVENAVDIVCGSPERCATKISHCLSMYPEDEAASSACVKAQSALWCLDASAKPQCETDAGRQSALHRVQQDTQRLCGEAAGCMSTLQRCANYMIPNDTSDPTGYLKTICANWPAIKKCYTDMPTACRRTEEFRENIDIAWASAEVNHYFACDPKGAGCPAVGECFSAADRELGRDKHSTDVPTIIRSLCRLSPMFDCLDNVSSTCNIDQGTVTFDEVKGVVMEFCQDVLPHASPMLQCGQFTQCFKQRVLAGETTLLASSGGETEDMWDRAHRAVSTARTGFWCSCLEGTYQCALDNAEACGIAASAMSVSRQQRDKLADMCVGTATAAPLDRGPDSGAAWTSLRSQRGSPLVLLLAAILVTWLSDLRSSANH